MAEKDKPSAPAKKDDAVKNISDHVINLESGPLKPGESGQATPYEKLMLGAYIA